MSQGHLTINLGIAASVLLGGAALAHPHPDGDAKERTTERIVIVSEKRDAEHGAQDARERIREFRIEGRDVMADCGGDKTEVEESTGDKEKTRIIICDAGANGAERAEHLERALARIEANEALSAEHKVRITAKLREAIDKARAR
jgi:prophage tail gpP-like protein